MLYLEMLQAENSLLRVMISVTLLPVCRVVDFGPGTDVNYAFTAQSVMNPFGKSPPFCSEF
jgi:hypothetical protein